MDIKSIGVIGAGVMGGGVAHNLAQKGFQVILLDISEHILENAEKNIRNALRFEALYKNQRHETTITEVVRRITFSSDYQLLKEVDFLIENVPEKWDIKKHVYQQIDSICPPHTIFAANTSAISITRIASLTRRAAKVIGIHFMNPVPLKPMVEMIRGYHTSEETIAIAQDLLSALDKDSILVKDTPGFVTNRVLMLTINEAIFAFQDQEIAAEEIDKLFKACFGHKMGPLETADLIGLDTILFSIEVLYESFNDSKYRPCPLLRKMVDAGLYGRKSGQGFYTYR